MVNSETSSNAATRDERPDTLPSNISKFVVILMGVSMVVLILVIILIPRTQVRFQLAPDAEWNDELIIQNSGQAIQTLGYRPVELVRPNPDAPDAASYPPGQGPVVSVHPNNDIYQTIYWLALEEDVDDTVEPATIRLTVKQLGNEFIAWPRHVE